MKLASIYHISKKKIFGDSDSIQKEEISLAALMGDNNSNSIKSHDQHT